ncbi:hypothetical protein BKA70DRAFT_1235638 [Coprinopsis sp. MPI-PUGE-AT-0042]|nr:hypothetical protein BKA70DRAFT_1235638 [Coprinopsis sp. MPI-PUGE-AT-0042]
MSSEHEKADSNVVEEWLQRHYNHVEPSDKTGGEDIHVFAILEEPIFEVEKASADKCYLISFGVGPATFNIKACINVAEKKLSSNWYVVKGSLGFYVKDSSLRVHWDITLSKNEIQMKVGETSKAEPIQVKHNRANIRNHINVQNPPRRDSRNGFRFDFRLTFTGSQMANHNSTLLNGSNITGIIHQSWLVKSAIQCSALWNGFEAFTFTLREMPKNAKGGEGQEGEEGQREETKEKEREAGGVGEGEKERLTRSAGTGSGHQVDHSKSQLQFRITVLGKHYSGDARLIRILFSNNDEVFPRYTAPHENLPASDSMRTNTGDLFKAKGTVHKEVTRAGARDFER